MTTPTDSAAPAQTRRGARLADCQDLRIAKRYEAICLANDAEPAKRIDTMMTLHFANQDDSLDYARLESFPDFDFMHDVCGMLRHMNRSTCKLGDFFAPRCSKPDPAQ